MKERVMEDHVIPAETEIHKRRGEKSFAPTLDHDGAVARWDFGFGICGCL
jgi:hypothetical protein